MTVSSLYSHFWEKYEQLTSFIRNNGLNTPIYLTGIGWPTSGNINPKYPNVTPVMNAAKKVFGKLICVANANKIKYFYHSAFDSLYDDIFSSPSEEYNWGLATNDLKWKSFVTISFLSGCETTSTANSNRWPTPKPFTTQSSNMITPLYGLAYGIYRDKFNSCQTWDEINQDLANISIYARAIRTYAINVKCNHEFYILKAAVEYNIDVYIGLYVDDKQIPDLYKSNTAYDKQLDHLDAMLMNPLTTDSMKK